MSPTPHQLRISAAMKLHWKKRKANKYNNVKCEWRGEKFDSKRELERHLVLLDMQKRGEIKNLKRQPRFKLEVNGQLICTYVGDWRYDDNSIGFLFDTVEDAKGFKTPEFKLKWKLCKALYPEIDWRLS